MTLDKKGCYLTHRYFLTIFVTVLGGSCQFFSFCIVNQVQNVLLSWIKGSLETRFLITLNEANLKFIWSLVVGSLSIGALLGALLVRTLAERCGRRNALLINGIFNVIAAMIVFMGQPMNLPELLLFGRFLLGVNMGLSAGIVPLYIDELTPAAYRGAAGTLHLIAISFSNWFALFIGLPEILGGEETWPYAFALPGLFALVLCNVLPFCPESPKYLLVNRGDPDGALEAMITLYGAENGKIEYHRLIEETSDEESHNGSFMELFRSQKLRFSLFMAILVIASVQFSGFSAVMAYSTNMFINAQLTPMAKYATLAVGVFYFLCSCIAPLIVDRVGRRPFYLSQRILSLITLICFTGFTAIDQYGKQIWASYGTIITLIIYMCLFGIGSPLPWTINLELFPPKYKSAGMGVSVFVVYGLSFLITITYLPFQEMVGVTFSYFPFILLSVICCFLLYLYLPETRIVKEEKTMRITISTRSLGFQSA